MQGARGHGPSRPERGGGRAAGTRRDSRAGRSQGRPGAGRDRQQGRPAGGPGPAVTVDADRLAGLIAPVASAAGMDLESVRVSRAGRRLLLRVVVDADGGVGLDDIADVSRDVAAVIERDDEMRNAPYTLEVSSPGVDRPLTEPKHWRRAAGRLVSAPLAASGQPPGGRAADGKAADGKAAAGKTRDGEAAASRPASVQGRVIAATSDAVTLEVDGATRAFGYDELGPGRVQVEFARAAAGQDGQKGQGGPEGTDSGEPATPDRGDGGLTDGH